ncbi:MAG TPA: hemerythrin domain-containing protein, partial [Acidimicrobiia bacterium]|nr:hemerythrin domain-containing protein [Acidimicrobiia bacterium]
MIAMLVRTSRAHTHALRPLPGRPSLRGPVRGNNFLGGLAERSRVPDVTTLIEQDHRAVERLFARYKEDRAMATVRRICDALDAQANAEEAVFYRAVRDEVPDGARIAHRATSDHGRVRD